MENESPTDPIGNTVGTALEKQTKLSLSKLMLLIVLAIILVAGLLPRGSFDQNWLEWDKITSTTEFGAYGLAHSNFDDLSHSFDRQHQLVFDFVITPRAFVDGEFRILLQIDSANDPEPFIIGQWENHLIVLQGQDFSNQEARPRLGVDIGEFIDQELSVGVKLNQARNELYLNGQLVRHHSPSVYELAKADARITIGNSPDGKHGWGGGVKKLEVFLQDTSTKQTEVIRRYDFSSRFSSEIADLSTNAVPLQIPKPGNFPDKRILQHVEIDHLIALNKFDVIINFLGFGPLGFLVALVLRQNLSHSKILLPFFGAVVVGCLVSLGIELSQPMIPGRNSHMHDLVLNVLGATCGGLAFTTLAAIAKRLNRKHTVESPTT